MQSLLVVWRSLAQELRKVAESIAEILVFIASFLRFLHCGRYPWLWNDEHVLVLPAVVGIGLLFCVLARG